MYVADRRQGEIVSSCLVWRGISAFICNAWSKSLDELQSKSRSNCHQDYFCIKINPSLSINLSQQSSGFELLLPKRCKELTFYEGVLWGGKDDGPAGYLWFSFWSI